MSEKNYLDKAGALYEAIKIKEYVGSNYANKSEFNSLSSSESAHNSQHTSEIGSLNTVVNSLTVENSNQADDISSLSTSVSENTAAIDSLSVAQSEAGGNVGARLDSLSLENQNQGSEITSVATSLSELENNIASTSTSQSEVDSTQNVSISSLTTENSTQTSEINSLSTASSELASEIDYLSSEVADKTEIDDSATTINNTWSASKIQAVINALNALTFAVVNVLPTTDIDTHTIYLVPKTSTETGNYYDEYLYVNNQWEHLGDTKVDLSGYVRETDLVPITNAEIDAMFE